MYKPSRELFQALDLPQIYVDPDNALDPELPIVPLTQRQLTMSWSGYNPRGQFEAHNMLWNSHSSESIHTPVAMDQNFPLFSEEYHRAPRPVVPHDGWDPTEPYPRSVCHVRMPSPVEFHHHELSERSCSSINGPMSPRATELNYSPNTTNLMAHDFLQSDESYSLRQNHDLLHVSCPQGRSSAHDNFVSLTQLQQRPDTLMEESMSLADANSPILNLGMGGHDAALLHDIAAQAADFDALDATTKHMQLGHQHAHDSGIGSSPNDEDTSMDADADEGKREDIDADADAETISDDDIDNRIAERDYELASFPRNRRQVHAVSAPMHGTDGKRAGPSPRTRSRRQSESHKPAGHRVAKPQGPSKTSRTLIPKMKGTDGKKTAPRPYPCLLRPLCKSTFSSKNEWKRHISTRHLELCYWQCPLEHPPRKRQSVSESAAAATATAAVERGDNSEGVFETLHSSYSAHATEDDGADCHTFNRKDLFAQHLRRIHMESPSFHTKSEAPRSKPKSGLGKAKTPSSSAMTESKSLKSAPLPDDLARYLDTECITIRSPPANPTCFMCNASFDGPSAWDQRIECLGRHFQAGEDWPADGAMDEEFVDWMLREGLLTRNSASTSTSYGGLAFVEK